MSERRTTDTPSIRLRHVDLTFGEGDGRVNALRDISLEVATREFVAVLGPSGCGKSTLLRLADGLLAPSAGSIEIFGYPMVAPRDDIAFVFQRCSLLPWLNVMDNLLFPVKHRDGRISAAQRASAKDWLATVGLADFADSAPDNLSGGMQQRLGIARALLLDADILLMDEPFSALDAMTRDDMGFTLMNLWSAHPKTVVFVTHSIPEAVFLADRIVVMSSRPGTIREIVDVDLPRPRGIDTASTPRFQQLTADLRRRHFSREASANA